MRTAELANGKQVMASSTCAGQSQLPFCYGTVILRIA